MMKDQYLQIIVLLVQKEAQKGKVPNPVKHGKQEKQGKQELEDIVKL
jgi:hypothetical protein